jgi:thymidylate kinase
MKIISFSGIDGAGKSTQICALAGWLRQSGFKPQLLSFWDNVAAFARLREFISLRVFKGEQGVGRADRPINRRDKNVSSWPVTVARFGLYFADVISLALTIRRMRRHKIDVLIFDRYIYDELANLPLHRKSAQIFIRLLLKLTPQPDVAYVIDADPVAALARKPEYPLAFLRRNRQAYLDLSRFTGKTTVIEPLSTAAMQSRIRAALAQTPLPNPNLQTLTFG